MGERRDDPRSGDTNTVLGLRKVLIEHRPRRSIFRPVLSSSPPTIRRLNHALGEPPTEQERWGSNFTVRRIAAESVLVINLPRIHRIPVSMVGKDVDPARAKLDGLLVRIGGSVG